MKQLFLFSIAMTVLSACGSPETVSNDDTLRYLALGDSYTIGESVSENERYPDRLSAMLTAKGKPTELLTIARTGWTTDELSDAIDAADIDGKKFDLVTLLIGVNNEYRGWSIDTYEKEFSELLDQAVVFARSDKKHVFVISIPDYGYTPFGAEGQREISPRIDAFNARAKKICDRKGIVFVDITPVSRKGLDIPDLVAIDGLHPSGVQYKLWTELLFPQVLTQLKNC